ncbi:MAG: hypothetical protein A2W93_03255 [Bacteroidetes bacterium GWF2_43_63]|nr:MAG: hypothetical protein A2W94_09255 [Bacteroidetes bacterium GWE2_42_42]OFY53677.1 MAG: hypothetical protein A2W93_03255 [Bacteroidetes bacterium GWF2_43_63]HBG70977.1 hypothetical protein [Bacteroidales bacterium]HCB62932.1 hypothetical protein [Bacteroidales bacterium]HCY24304.1 hypothetical protein [Bacteroidales bacterium]
MRLKLYKQPVLTDKQFSKTELGVIFYVFLPQTKSMKKIALFIVVSLVAGVIGNVSAQKKQKPFKGIVTYDIKYEGDIDAATLANLPSTQSSEVLGKYLKVETLVPGATIEMISNGYDSTRTVLYDIPGLGKYCVRTTKAQIMASLEEGKPADISYIDETKEVSGYTCSKADYVVEDEYGDKISIIIFYSTVLGGPELNYVGNFPGLKGFPMEYTIKSDDMTIIYSVSSVQTKKVKLKDTDFLIPTDYEEISEEDFMKKVQGE